MVMTEVPKLSAIFSLAAVPPTLFPRHSFNPDNSAHSEYMKANLPFVLGIFHDTTTPAAPACHLFWLKIPFTGTVAVLAWAQHLSQGHHLSH
jgi:hypothetical protein